MIFRAAILLWATFFVVAEVSGVESRHQRRSDDVDAPVEDDSSSPDAQLTSYSLSPFENEDSCLRQGGICVEKALCSPAALADKPDESRYLCPAQKDAGAACCFGLPNKKLPCGMRGGFCRAACGRALTADPFGICPDPTGAGGREGTVCCPLLQ